MLNSPVMLALSPIPTIPPSRSYSRFRSSAATIAACLAAACSTASSTGTAADAGPPDASTPGDAGAHAIDSSAPPATGDAGHPAPPDGSTGTRDSGGDGGGGGPDSGSGSSDSGAASSDSGSNGRDAGPGVDARAPTTCDAAVGAGDRIITIVNECPGQTIHVGINGGYVEDCVAGTCPNGTTCNTTRNPAGCFWDFPAPTCGTEVLSSGASATYVLSAPPITAPGAGSAIKWSGNLYASSACAPDGTGCKTAQCATSAGGKTTVGPCPDGVGPAGPTTLAEFTLVPNGADFYDISSINGVNIPVSMVPTGGVLDPSNPYTCGAAGAVTPSAGLEGCSWTFDTNVVLNSASTNESALLRAVAPGGATCSTDTDCSGGSVCGTALAFGVTTAARTCGLQVGWWTADELCVYTGNTFGAPLNCSQAVSGQGTNASLFGCNGSANSGSCYSNGASATCCGCPDWVVGGKTLPVPSSFSCKSNNSSWQTVAEPWAAFVKNACPTAYSFPFDDATSTFTCNTPNPSNATPNGVGYTITFCPGGVTGY